MVVAKCLKLIWNHSGIISGTYFSPFQGFYYLYRGLRRAPKPYFRLILEFWIIFLIFLEWIIWLNILNSIEWIFFWMNILDLVLNWILNWIIFWPNSMKKWIFKTYRTGLYTGQFLTACSLNPLSIGCLDIHSLKVLRVPPDKPLCNCRIHTDGSLLLKKIKNECPETAPCFKNFFQFCNSFWTRAAK